MIKKLVLRRPHFLLALILFVSTILNFWGLDNFDLSSDEEHYIQRDAAGVYSNYPYVNARHHPYRHPPNAVGSPFLTQDLMVLSFKIFGPSVYSARAVNALAVTLLVLVTYLLGKNLYDKKVGLISSFFVAISPLAVRYAKEGHLDPVFALTVSFSFLFFWLSFKHKRLLFALLAGVFTALAWSTKINGPILIGSYLIFFLLYWLKTRHLRLEKSYTYLILAGFISFAIVFFLLVDPYSYWDGIIHNQDKAFARGPIWLAGYFFWGKGWLNVWQKLIMALWTPLFTFLSLVGLILILCRSRVESMLILAWLLGFGSIFLTHTNIGGPNGFLPYLPPMAILAALTLNLWQPVLRYILFTFIILLIIPNLVLYSLRQESFLWFSPQTIFNDNNFFYGENQNIQALKYLNNQTKGEKKLVWLTSGKEYFPVFAARSGLSITPFDDPQTADYVLVRDEEVKDSLLQSQKFKIEQIFNHPPHTPEVERLLQKDNVLVKNDAYLLKRI